MSPKPSTPSTGKPSKRRASDASGPRQIDLHDAFGASPKHARRGSLASEDPLEVQVTPRQYDAFTVKFLETEGTARGFSAADREEDSRRSEAEFVAAFDVLLRNHREFVPPQHFLERLTHILLRKRERVARSVFRRDDDDEDDDEDDDGGGFHKKREKTEADASLAAREDDRLLRATAEIFRRVNERHPVAVAARFDAGSAVPSASTLGKAHLRVGARTWTPLDSDRRAGSFRERAFTESNSGSRGQNRDGDTRVAGSHARGARADWNRFVALLGAARGDSELLDALMTPAGGSRSGSAAAETSRAASSAARAEGRGARANRRNAYADADFATRDASATKRKANPSGAGDGEEESDDEDDDEDDDEAPLGVALLFVHAVDVLVQDAHARLAVFESRVRERAAEREKIKALAADAAAATPSAAPPLRDGADESPVPDSQPTPSSRDASLRDADAADSAVPSGAWAGDLLRNALVYRLVGVHAPSDADRTRLFRDLLELAGAAARRAASDAVAQTREARDASARGTTRRPATSLRACVPGREDVGLESLGAAAASALSAFDDVLSALHAHGATRGDRAAEKLRTQLDEARVRFFRADRRSLRQAGAKKAFLDAANVAGGQEETRALRVVRGALRAKVTARRAPGLMRPGLGVVAGASGALDVFRYVSDDAKDAIKCMAFDDASVRRAEACDLVAHFAAAAAKAAARIAGREEEIRGASTRKTCADAFRLTHERFAEEALLGDALTVEGAAAVDAAAGTLRCYET